MFPVRHLLVFAVSREWGRAPPKAFLSGDAPPGASRGVEAHGRRDGRRVHHRSTRRYPALATGSSYVWEIGTGVLRNDVSGETLGPE
jgi:hypothetical protein